MCVATEPSPELRELRAYLAKNRPEIEARDFLQSTWRTLNQRAFGGSLKSLPAFILSDFEGDPNVMGQFISGDDGQHLIQIHAAFFFDDGTVPKQDREIAAGLVLLHEMIHQRRRDRGCRDLDCHGPEFVKEANRLSRIMGLNRHISIEGDCQTRYWPFDVEPGFAVVTGLILHEYKNRAGVPSGV